MGRASPLRCREEGGGRGVENMTGLKHRFADLWGEFPVTPSTNRSRTILTLSGFGMCVCRATRRLKRPKDDAKRECGFPINWPGRSRRGSERPTERTNFLLPPNWDALFQLLKPILHDLQLSGARLFAGALDHKEAFAVEGNVVARAGLHTR
jgi:hypothetical protein